MSFTKFIELFDKHYVKGLLTSFDWENKVTDIEYNSRQATLYNADVGVEVVITSKWGYRSEVTRLYNETPRILRLRRVPKASEGFGD